MLPAWLDRLQRGALLLTAALYSTGYGTWGLFLLLIAAVLEAVVTRRVPWPRGRLDVLIALFLLAFLISGYLSPYRPVAVGSAGLAALMIYLAFGISSGVLRRDRQFLVALMGAWVAGGLIAALWGMFLVLSTGQPASTPELGRNALGTTLLIASLLSVGLMLEVQTWWRYLAAVVCIVLLGALVVTYARGAWLGVTAGMIVLMALSGLKRTLHGPVVVLAVVLAGVVLLGPVRAIVVRRASTIPNLAVNRDRVILFQTSLRIFVDHPLFGTGLNTFGLVYPRYRLPDDPNPMPLPFAHNIFVNMAVEGGLLGLATFVGILMRAISAGWRWHRAAHRPQPMTAATILAALTGALVHQLFDGTLISVHLGLGLWVLLAVLSTGGSWAGAAQTTSEWTSA